MNYNKPQDQEFTKIIRPSGSLFDLRFKCFWEYRDFNYLIFFEARFLIYAALIIYPIKSITSGYTHFVMANPLIGVVESFSWRMLINSFIFMILLISTGILIFNKVEQSFMDTV